MDEDSPCDVCGSLFNDDLIETCSTCNIREHRYCMEEVCRTVPDDWECNSCQKAKEKISRESGRKEDRVASSAGSVHHDVKHPAGPSRVIDDSRWQAHPKRQKPVETGKVKFLPNEEAIRLASGVQTMGSQRNFNSKHSNSNFMAPTSPRTPLKSKTGTPKFPLSKANPTIIPSGTEKSPRHGTPVKMQSISKLIQQTSPTRKDPKEPKASLAQNLKKHGSSAPLVAEMSPAKEVRPSKLIVQNGEDARADGKTCAAEHNYADGEELRDAEPKASLAQNSKKRGSSAFPVAEVSPAKDVRPSKHIVQNDGKTRAAEHNHADGEELRDAEPKASLAQNSKKRDSSAFLVADISPAKEVRPSKLIVQNDGKTRAAEHNHADGEELRDAEPKASLAHNSKKRGSNAPPVAEISSAKEVRPSKLNTQNGEDERADSKTQVAEDNHDGEESRDVLNIFMSINLNHSSLPAPDATWNGGFILDTATPRFIGGFQAQPSYKFRDFHPKGYAFSQKMPLILKANLISRSHLWSDVFQDECPDLQDVALYFFPSDNIESSRENNVSLIELMGNQDLMMRICFDGEDVELLIFTSRVLQLDSQLISFLWGIFRSTKKVQDHHKVDEVLPSMVDQANMVDSDIVDMEIDMLRGVMVGRADIVVGWDPEVTRNTETSSGLKTTSGLKANSGKEEGEISAETEKELEGPPGFCKGSTQSATSVPYVVALSTVKNEY